MRLLVLLGLLLAFVSPLSALNITVNSTIPCSSWTGWAPYNITDAPVYDMTYKRDCDNVTYISYCLSRPTYINFSHARFYTGLNCSRKDFCQGWTRFYPDVKKNITERTPDNMTRICTNTTYISWCLKDHSNIDYRTGRRYYQLTCTDWTQACFLKEMSSLLKVEQGDTLCRMCNQTTYRPTCNFSGRVSTGKSQVDSSCGDWMDCAILQPKKYARPSSYSSDSSDKPIGLDSSSLIVALLMGIGLTAVLVLAFSGKKE